MTHRLMYTPSELKTLLSPSAQARQFIEQMRHTLCDLLSGKDRRKLCIVGPCSIHDCAAAIDYGQHLKQLASEIGSSCVLVMRVYVEKARSTLGWKGLVYDPDLNGSSDIKKGLFLARELFVSLSELGIACALECVDPVTTLYLDDLISWGCIGARTSTSQIHRQLASQLPFAMGFKNSIDGNIEAAIQGMRAAAEPHSFLSLSSEGHLQITHSEGNPYTHLVLRGSQSHPNYDPQSIALATALCKQYALPPRIMIDCSHGNVQKEAARQQHVFLDTLESSLEEQSPLIGWMIESHLQGGNQPLTKNPADLQYARSITDPCLGWTQTEALLHTAHARLVSLLEPSLTV